MPPRQKSLHNFFVEIVLFISLFAVVGHLSVNFFERYMVQTELTKMKTSLHTLKDTINHIGVSYNQLYKELHGLAEVVEKGTELKGNAIPDNYGDKTDHTHIAKKLLEDIQIQAMIDSGVKVEDLQNIKTEMTQTATNKNTQIALNASTSYNLATFLKGDKKDQLVIEDKIYHNKNVQHMHVKTLQTKHSKNTGISMNNNTLQSKTAGTEDEVLQNSLAPHLNNKHKRESNIHKCNDNVFCTTTDDSEYDYSRF